MNNKDFGYIYFMSNEYNTTLYIGVTSNLKMRIYQHRNKMCEGFSKKYNLTKFLYFEKYNSIVDAIKREKQIKNFKREWKFDLIKRSNPLMIDLYDWVMDNEKNNINIKTKIIEEKGNIYEIPNCAIADQVRNDELNNKFQFIKIQCPAKINLTLKITGKRDDGFHNIDSVMQTINLFDYLTISIEESDHNEIVLSGTSDEIPYNEKNLVYKAAILFVESIKKCHPEFISGSQSEMLKQVQHDKSVKITVFIEKNIPIAAGLAGGSTDAAGTLYGLNKLFGEPLSREKLHELCAQLGSDLNLCLEGGCQRTTGRGEILEPMPFEEFNVSLIKPTNLGISAKEAYTKFSEKMEMFPHPLREGVRGWGVNHRYISCKLKKNAKELRNNPTPQEQKLWQYLRKSQFANLKFRRQHPIGNYIVDFVSFDARLIIELDGGQHSETMEYDKHRDAFLHSQDFKVIRIWNNDIDKNIEGVLEFVEQSLQNPTPKPPPARGGGVHEAFANDLEWAVIDDYKELQQIKELYPDAIMSGSGSTYFGIDITFDKLEGFWVKNNLKTIPFGVKEV